MANLNPNSKPFTPLNGSGATTPGTAFVAAAAVQQSTAATITEAAERLTPRNQRKPEALPGQVQSTIGLEKTQHDPENQKRCTEAEGAAASSEMARQQQVHWLPGSAAHADRDDARIEKRLALTLRATRTACCPLSQQSAGVSASWALASMQRAYMLVPCGMRVQSAHLRLWCNAQGQDDAQPAKISPQLAFEGPALSQSVGSPIRAAPERPEPQGSPKKAPGMAASAAVASALSGIKTSPRRSTPVMMPPKLGLGPGQAAGRSAPERQPTDSPVQVQSDGTQAAPALRQLTGQQGQPTAQGSGAQQAGGSPVLGAAKPPVPPLLLAKIPALNVGAAAQRASGAALQSPAGQPVISNTSTKASPPLPVHSAPRQLPKPIPRRPVTPVAKPVRTLLRILWCHVSCLTISGDLALG